MLVVRHVQEVADGVDFPLSEDEILVVTDSLGEDGVDVGLIDRYQIVFPGTLGSFKRWQSCLQVSLLCQDEGGQVFPVDVQVYPQGLKSFGRFQAEEAANGLIHLFQFVQHVLDVIQNSSGDSVNDDVFVVTEVRYWNHVDLEDRDSRPSITRSIMDRDIFQGSVEVHC